MSIKAKQVAGVTTLVVAVVLVLSAYHLSTFSELLLAETRSRAVLLKGALFLIAGAIDHEAGVRDVTLLRGLRHAMPITAVAGGVAALSMAGVPLTLGFIAKDGAYEALLHGGEWLRWLLFLTVAPTPGPPG